MTNTEYTELVKRIKENYHLQMRRIKRCEMIKRLSFDFCKIKEIV
jgi:hypothetical protein